MKAKTADIILKNTPPEKKEWMEMQNAQREERYKFEENLAKMKIGKMCINMNNEDNSKWIDNMRYRNIEW